MGQKNYDRIFINTKKCAPVPQQPRAEEEPPRMRVWHGCRESLMVVKRRRMTRLLAIVM